MNTTLFLSQLWGPILLALGVGFFTSRSYYSNLYRNLDQQSFAVFIFSILAILLGIIQIQAHNVWETPLQVIISILGWGTFLKGVIFAIAPRFVDQTAAWEADKKLIPFAGGLMLVLGAFLTWVSYMA